MPQCSPDAERPGSRVARTGVLEDGCGHRPIRRVVRSHRPRQPSPIIDGTVDLFGGEAQIGELAHEIVAALPRDRYPHSAAVTIEHVLRPGYRFGDSFDVGLDLILDGLDARARREAGAAAG